ncbi:MAG: hypothetical protein K2Y22_06160 [Candidatus Obscuribacterales bacterium]|nr:hypothetical protein [Candidatus Obscuribacterales bacterium]
MNTQLDEALEAFRRRDHRLGEEQLTKFLEEQACTDHVSIVADRAERLFNEASKTTEARLRLDLLCAPKNPDMLPVDGGIMKACTAEFRLFSLDENGKVNGVRHEFVARYRLFLPWSGQKDCRCHPH